jgi:opacity protein-like surface antigen
MGRFKALTFASVLALGAAQAAQAADLLPPPPPIEAPPLRGAVIDDPGGFYLRVDGGLANNMASGLRSTFADGNTMATLGATENNVSLSDSWLLGIGVGYQFNSWLRADLTGEYRTSANYHSSSSNKWGTPATNPNGCPAGGPVSCGDEYTGLVKSGLLLFNTYLDMGTWRGFTPYVGAGVGAAIYQTSDIKDTSQFPNNNATAWGYANNHVGVNLAWALMAGVSYHITPSLLIDASYRYVNMGDFKTGAILCNDMSSCHFETQQFTATANDVRVGLRWLAAADPVIFDPGLPVRAKY